MSRHSADICKCHYIDGILLIETNMQERAETLDVLVKEMAKKKNLGDKPEKDLGLCNLMHVLNVQ